MPDTIDIAICGAGPVGLALAVLLVKRGTDAARIVLIDAKPVEVAAQDPRSIALSYGSRQLLEEVDAWPSSTTAIHQIHVSRRGHFGRTLIDRDTYHLPALGYVARYGALVNALSAQAGRMAIPAFRPAQVVSVTAHENAVDIRLSDERAIRAGIVVQAEGGVFADQQEKSLRKDYEQTAVVAHVIADAPVAHRAYERFTAEGPLALLPQDDGYALVWCARPDTAAHLLKLSDPAFLAELGHAFGERLGRFTAVSRRSSYPLGLNAHPPGSDRIIAIGNAAQTLHPVAGQGLNLGLRDAAVLARLLSRDLSPAGIRDFDQARRQDRHLTIRLTDAMAHIFTGSRDDTFLQGLLGLSLGIIDMTAPAKKLLAHQMMFGLR